MNLIHSSRFVLGMLVILTLVGCARSTPPPRSLKGQLEYEQAKPEKIDLLMSPSSDTAEKDGVEVMMRYATQKELDEFFSNKVIFGKYAGDNPYPEGTIVFYVKISNKSGHRIKVMPENFVLVDDKKIQYIHLSPDDISAMYESRGDMWSFAKTTGDLAPGYYGAPLKVATAFGDQSSRRANYLIRQARLTGGYVHNDVTYDGYVAFPRPHPDAKTLKVILSSFKTQLDPADEPTASVDFEFNFSLSAAAGDKKSVDKKSDRATKKR